MDCGPCSGSDACIDGACVWAPDQYQVLCGGLDVLRAGRGFLDGLQ